jgi:hypothetical protein
MVARVPAAGQHLGFRKMLFGRRGPRARLRIQTAGKRAATTCPPPHRTKNPNRFLVGYVDPQARQGLVFGRVNRGVSVGQVDVVLGQ